MLLVEPYFENKVSPFLWILCILFFIVKKIFDTHNETISHKHPEKLRRQNCNANKLQHKMF